MSMSSSDCTATNEGPKNRFKAGGERATPWGDLNLEPDRITLWCRLWRFEFVHTLNARSLLGVSIEVSDGLCNELNGLNVERGTFELLCGRT